MRYRFSVLMGMILLTFVSAAPAQNLFQLNASSSTTTVNASGNNLINLVQNLTNNTQQFAPLNNQTFGANLSYAGIQNAFRFQQSFDTAGNRIVNFRIPTVGVNQTFSSANGSIDTQIRDYLKRNGLADLTAFQSVVDRNSFAGIVDGNPMAATAMLQDAGYQEFAMHESPFDIDGRRFTTDGGHIISRIWAGGGVLDAGGTTGTYVDLTFATEFRFNDIVGLSIVSPFRFQTLHSADIFMGGTVLGVPISILPARGGPISWTLTPAGHVVSAGSQDFVSGGLVFGGQLDSSLSLSLGDFRLTLADNAGYYKGASLDIAGYHFNTRVDQWIFKNGLQISKSWGNFFLDASGSYTSFARDAYVSGYFSPELGVGFRFGANDTCGLRVGYTGNFGNGYNTNGGSVLLYFTQ